MMENDRGEELAEIAYKKASALLTEKRLKDTDVGPTRLQKDIILEYDQKISVSLEGSEFSAGKFKNIMIESSRLSSPLLEPVNARVYECVDEIDGDETETYSGPLDSKYIRIEPTELSLEGLLYLGKGSFRLDKFGPLDLAQRERVIFVLDRLGIFDPLDIDPK